MISTESAETSNLGEILSSSEVMLAKGDASDGGEDAGAAAVELLFRLWKEPFLGPRIDTRFTRDSLRQDSARRGIIELSCSR